MEIQHKYPGLEVVNVGQPSVTEALMTWRSPATRRRRRRHHVNCASKWAGGFCCRDTRDRAVGRGAQAAPTTKLERAVSTTSLVACLALVDAQDALDLG